MPVRMDRLAETQVSCGSKRDRAIIEGVRLAALPLMSLALGTLLSCRSDQITVHLEARGCLQVGASEPGYVGTGVLGGQLRAG